MFTVAFSSPGRNNVMIEFFSTITLKGWQLYGVKIDEKLIFVALNLQQI